MDVDGRVMRYDALDAEDFLEHIEPNELLAPMGSAWIYRGHGDAQWPLLPSLWRDPWQFDTILANSITDTDYEAALTVERALVDDFVRRANDLGFVLPGDLRYRGPLARSLSSRYEVSDALTIDDRQRALAQHYGIPTSLLDWSENPLVAAHFAALSTPDSGEDGLLCVWALNEIVERRWPGRGLTDPMRPAPRLRVVRLMKGLNPNITAQQGAFTIIEGGDGEWTLDDTGEMAFRNFMTDLVDIESWVLALQRPVPQPCLVKVTLPHSERPQLKALLERRGISGARLVPQLDSVAREVLQHSSSG